MPHKYLLPCFFFCPEVVNSLPILANIHSACSLTSALLSLSKINTTACIICLPYNDITWSIWLLWVTRFLNKPNVFITTLISESDNNRKIWSARKKRRRNFLIKKVNKQFEFLKLIIYLPPNAVIIWTFILWSDWNAMFIRPQTPFSLKEGSYLCVNWHKSSIAPLSTERIIKGILY